MKLSDNKISMCKTLLDLCNEDNPKENQTRKKRNGKGDRQHCQGIARNIGNRIKKPGTNAGKLNRNGSTKNLQKSKVLTSETEQKCKEENERTNRTKDVLIKWKERTMIIKNKKQFEDVTNTSNNSYRTKDPQYIKISKDHRYAEVKSTLSKLNKNKSAGTNRIVTQMLSVLNGFGTDKFTGLYLRQS